MADNASITILRNTKANIDAEPIKDGNILFTTDQVNNGIYTDVGTKRIKIGGTVDVDTELSTTSTNPVQNKVITNSINDVRGQIHTNLLNPTAKTQTISGVTFTNNGDGTYTVNGKNSSSSTIFFQFVTFTPEKNMKCKFMGTPPTSSLGEEGCLRLNENGGLLVSDKGSGAMADIKAKNTYDLYIRVGGGVTLNNFLFKPMLTTDLSATYDDFVPYTGDSGKLNEDVANFFDIVRPVGSLYPTTDSSFNPNTAKGWHGTWERITDCVIYAAGTSDTIGQIVGSNTHTLTEAELPSHTHSIPALSGSTNKTGAHTHNASIHMPFGTDWIAGQNMWSASSSNMRPDFTIGVTTTASGEHTHTVTTNASTTGSQGSGTAIDMRTRRLNSVVWRRTA